MSNDSPVGDAFRPTTTTVCGSRRSAGRLVSRYDRSNHPAGRRQPGCRFAWRLGALWDWRTFQDAGADPDEQVNWIEWSLDEDVEAVNYGDPDPCVEDELTFCGLDRGLVEEAVRRAPFPVLVPTGS